MNLITDECVPRFTYEVFSQFVKLRVPPVDAVHFQDRFVGGREDDDWTTDLLGETPRRIVITQDTGSTTKRDDPRMPSVLPALGITGVFFSPKLSNLSSFEKTRILIVLLPDIQRAWDVQQSGDFGRRYRIVPGSAEDRYRLEPWPVDPGEPIGRLPPIH